MFSSELKKFLLENPNQVDILLSAPTLRQYNTTTYINDELIIYYYTINKIFSYSIKDLNSFIDLKNSKLFNVFYG